MLPRLRQNQRSTLLSLSLKGAHAEDKWLTEVEICAGGRLSAAVALTTKGSGGEMWRHITSQASEAVTPLLCANVRCADCRRPLAGPRTSG